LHFHTPPSFISFALRPSWTSRGTSGLAVLYGAMREDGVSSEQRRQKKQTQPGFLRSSPFHQISSGIIHMGCQYQTNQATRIETRSGMRCLFRALRALYSRNVFWGQGPQKAGRGGLFLSLQLSVVFTFLLPFLRPCRSWLRGSPSLSARLAVLH